MIFTLVWLLFLQDHPYIPFTFDTELPCEELREMGRESGGENRIADILKGCVRCDAITYHSADDLRDYEQNALF